MAEAVSAFENQHGQLEAKLVEIRRSLHQEPELSNEEYETTRKLRQWLEAAGIEVLELPDLKTGLVAQIGSGEGPVVALRADIDALPIDEQTELPYRSRVPGKMHACGHDFHAAVAMGAAYLLKQREADLPGRVRIVLQPAEETCHGAKDVLASGALEGVSAIFGLHNDPLLEVGRFATCPGPITAGVDRFEIIVSGTGAHAATPEKGTDTIVAASQMVLALQTISSRLVSALEAVVVSVARINGGNTWNVLPETVELEGTVRTFNTHVQEGIPGQIRQIIGGIAAASGVSAELKWHPGAAATINHAHWAELAAETAGKAGYRTETAGPIMAGEDFSFYLQHIPGAFMFIGSGSSYPVHHPKFAPDEAALLPAAQFYSQLAVRALKDLHPK